MATLLVLAQKIVGSFLDLVGWNPTPAVVIIFSGKRKSGKDYITDQLLEKIGQKYSEIIRLSHPLKGQYAKEHNLSLDELLSAGPYKETYRLDMIRWGEAKRNADPGFFARIISNNATKPIWIVSDARRTTDVKYFKERYSTITVRVTASDTTRSARGWVFSHEVDDAESECGLDHYGPWDYVVANDGTAEDLAPFLAVLRDDATARLTSYRA